MVAGLQVSGMTPLTTIDFPDHLACVLYTQGCPLRCGYCHNPELIPFQADTVPVSWDDIDDFLLRRQGLLEAVVFSGGEPTLQAGLPVAIRRVKDRGYKVGLHSAGVQPARLKTILNHLDWVGLDVKAPSHLYARVTGRINQAVKNRQSLQLLLASGIAFECRTTVSWQQLQPEDILLLARQLAAEGVTRYALQVSHGQNCLDPRLRGTISLGAEPLADLRRDLESLFSVFEWRG
ncbi:anaerobic ribonucleoside-triphosphate reductase activating protein [Amphritea japonica]|uniref:Radical SAM protein n=1 Tax=Amphritea japonica ATCC BAA-1530 TaxID=1278309 RepID=A0A7R6PPC1_9GAMM|nr:anaerobic ribonucleoside-triphosphate reductase activating protein [Amphritea japonica]BBB27043.1 radical SAM protein [Amphritea japonica ATCC BAA-1530]